jgi:predicted amidohydrolase YtcJ
MFASAAVISAGTADPSGQVDHQRRRLARAATGRAAVAHRRRAGPGHHRPPGAAAARRAQRGAQLGRAAGIGPGTPDVAGGFIARDAAGHPSGWLQDAALELARGVLPPLPDEALAGGLREASRGYAAHGLGTVRDPAVSPEEWRTYLRAAAAGQLSVRSHAMIFTTPAAIEAAGSLDGYLDSLDEQGIRPGAGDGLLRVWGLKFVLDGGVEAAALERPYTDRPGYRGELMWQPGELAGALAGCARRGRPVGTHAMGDRAVSVLLGAIRAAAEQAGPVPAGTLGNGGLSCSRPILDGR